MSRITQSYLKDLTYRVNGAAIEVHKNIGPGLLESVYHKCLKKELDLRNISFQSELIIPIHYKGIDIEAELRCDLYIENILCVELKAVKELHPIHEAQLMTYMKLLKSPKGIYKRNKRNKRKNAIKGKHVLLFCVLLILL